MSKPNAELVVLNHGMVPGRKWTWARRLTQAIGLFALLAGPLLAGWRRLEQSEFAAWRDSGSTLPHMMRDHLPSRAGRTGRATEPVSRRRDCGRACFDSADGSHRRNPGTHVGPRVVAGASGIGPARAVGGCSRACLLWLVLSLWRHFICFCFFSQNRLIRFMVETRFRKRKEMGYHRKNITLVSLAVPRSPACVALCTGHQHFISHATHCRDWHFVGRTCLCHTGVSPIALALSEYCEWYRIDWH